MDCSSNNTIEYKTPFIVTSIWKGCVRIPIFELHVLGTVFLDILVDLSGTNPFPIFTCSNHCSSTNAHIYVLFYFLKSFCFLHIGSGKLYFLLPDAIFWSWKPKGNVLWLFGKDGGLPLSAFYSSYCCICQNLGNYSLFPKCLGLSYEQALMFFYSSSSSSSPRPTE